MAATARVATCSIRRRVLFGTGGNPSHGGEVLILKVPHLRNLHQKVGMFGLPNRKYFLPSTTDAHQGDQIRRRCE